MSKRYSFQLFRFTFSVNFSMLRKKKNGCVSYAQPAQKRTKMYNTLLELFSFCLVMLSVAAPRTNVFLVCCFFSQRKYRDYSSTEIQWLRDSCNESCSQERTNEVSQFRNESTAEGVPFMKAISGNFVVSAPAFSSGCSYVWARLGDCQQESGSW